MPRSNRVPRALTAGHVLAAGILLGIAASPAAGQEPPPQATETSRREPCAYVKGGELVRVLASCPDDACPSSERIEVGSLRLGPYDEPFPRVSCAPGQITIGSKDDALTLRWNTTTQRFELLGAITERIEALERAREGTRGALEEAAGLARRLGWAPDFAGAWFGRVALVVAREEIARGRWSDAAATLSSYQPFLEQLGMNVQRDALTARLAATEKDSAPLRLVRLRKVGTIENTPALPPASDPTVFWRDRRLCVRQEDGSATMRCFDSTSGRWAAREQVPALPAGLVALPGGGPCPDSYSLPSAVVPGRCGQFAADRVLAAGSGPMVILEGVTPGTAARWSRDGESPLSPAEAARLASGSLGSRLVAAGEYVFFGGSSYRPIANPQKRWEVVDRLPDGSVADPAFPALASPDGTSVLLLGPRSGARGFTLWIGTVERTTAPHR